MTFPHIASEKQQNFETTLDSDTSDITENDLKTSCDISELDDSVSDDDPLCNDNDDTSTMFEIEILYHQPLSPQSDSDISYHKPNT